MAMQIHKTNKSKTQKCEMPNCNNLANYKIEMQQLDTKSEICICESCCENLFCYDKKAEYDPKKEL